MEHNSSDTPNKIEQDKQKSPAQPWKSWLYIGLLILAAAVAAFVIWWAAAQTTAQLVVVQKTETSVQKPDPSQLAEPTITTETVLAGRQNIWDMGFLPSGELIFNERKGKISAFVNGQARELTSLSDVQAVGEGGLLGLAVDNKFTENRNIFVCFNTTAGDIKIARFKVNQDVTALGERANIVTGIPQTPGGRHSGCRLAFGTDGFLWVGTGDSAQGSTIPQDPKSLGGKILRIDRDGNGASGNMGEGFDSRVFSYGHRNTQGLAFFASPKSGVRGVSIEHGSYEDDEINPLVKGNFGWSPGTDYNELGVKMTDKKRFPDAVDAIWGSGSPTLAPSGAAVLKGNIWKAWQGRVAVAMLKTKHLRLFDINDQLKLESEKELFKDQFGRMRAVTLGPDGALYVSTDNSSDDKIIKVIPK